MIKTRTRKTIMLVMLTVLAMATLFVTDATNASASKTHHKKIHRIYHKKKHHKKKYHKKKYKRRVLRRVSVKKVTHHKKRTSGKGFTGLYRVASSKLGTPYSYGSAGPYSFDCSGFTQYVYRRAKGKHLARTAQMQYNTNRHVSGKHLRKGDLVFIGATRSSIYHVGMYVGGGRMIDAQNRGVITESIHAPWWHVVGYSRVA